MMPTGSTTRRWRRCCSQRVGWKASPWGLLLALRPVEGVRLDLAGVEQLPVEGLRREETAELMRDLPTEAVERLHAATAGNPLALLGAPANLPEEQLAGRDSLGDALPVGPGVQTGFRRRLDKLPPRTRLATVLVAAAAAETLAGRCRRRAAGRVAGRPRAR